VEVLVDTLVDCMPLLLLLAAYFIGRWVERRHYRSIRRREIRWRNLPVATFRRVPKAWEPVSCGLVTGSVVVSVDHFKRYEAGLRMLVGGRVKTYESLLDRARREAILRLKQDAMEKGYRAVVNLRLETARLASARRKGKATAGVEVLAFGTGIALGRNDP
jgi:uncharacterized protein YbjQ (UPF0145 family)